MLLLLCSFGMLASDVGVRPDWGPLDIAVQILLNPHGAWAILQVIASCVVLLMVIVVGVRMCRPCVRRANNDVARQRLGRVSRLAVIVAYTSLLLGLFQITAVAIDAVSTVAVTDEISKATKLQWAVDVGAALFPGATSVVVARIQQEVVLLLNSPKKS